MRSVLWWRGVAGIAETTYPHPSGWTFDELEPPAPLHKIRIRHLAIAFRNAITVPPTCKRAWEGALGESELPWHLVYQRDCTTLPSPVVTGRTTCASSTGLCAPGDPPRSGTTEDEWYHPADPPDPNKLDGAAAKLETALRSERKRIDRARTSSAAEALLKRRKRASVPI
eukprot:2827857-Prymnesium_polylepis.1